MRESSPKSVAAIGTSCAYCDRRGQQLEPCCDRPEHADRLVCQDSHDCLGVVLSLLHESEARLAEPMSYPVPQPGREPVVSLHADSDGVAPDAAPAAVSGRAELAARLTAARAVLADYVRWTSGEVLQASGAYDWQTWADRLATHLTYVIEAVSS
jgi:hypothetical protein